MIGNRQKYFYLIFALSGFSGLIYESIWSHYLKLFLGHAAYAQTLVIAIFMGGLAIGSWLCSRYTMRWKNLFIGYAIVEGVVGLCALFFHELFDQTLHVAFNSVLPNLSSPGTINLVKWVLSGLLILPQTILLGMTFPLMSAAMLRCYPKAPGRSLGMLYFTNSIGAALGVLTSGFLLINLLGLAGTIRCAGVINILLAFIVWALAKGLPQECKPLPEADFPAPSHHKQHFLLLSVALMTGMASFIYEIGWIRMLSMVLGSSTHAFELMLSSFIIGLALGSLWIKNRIERTSSPLKLLAFIQVLMGLFAVATLPLYDQTFYLMHWLLNTLEASSIGYILYMLSSNGIALLVMLPTTFCAGMTLPLITCIMLRELNGEKNIGAVYAANTVGAIVGVFFAVHIGMPLLGLKNLILFGASIDVVLGLTLFWLYCRKNGWQKKTVYIMTISILLLIAIGSFSKLDHEKMASGIFRRGQAITQDKLNVLYHKDGKTASVSLTQPFGSDRLTIRTNGKPDASVNMGTNLSNLSKDDSTQIQLAAIPMAMNFEAQTVAIIGFGSGVTTNVALKNPRIKRVDTIEIEPFMVKAAEHFGHRVELAYNDPRSKIFIEDAKTFFAGHKQHYDIIISEPSNPWVSGVANLFTKEFYKSVLPVLENDGVFAQWVQMYEIDLDLLGSIFKALSYNFSDYVVYTINTGDLLIVAKKSGELGPLSEDILNIPAIAKELQSVYINNSQDINFRRVGGKKTLQPYFDRLSSPTNSDYFPVLDQNANRVRFLGKTANSIANLNHQLFPLASLIEGQLTSDKATQITLTPHYTPSALAREAMQLRDYFLQDHKLQFDTAVDRNLPFEANAITSMCRGDYSGQESIRFGIIFNQGTRMVPHLSKSELLQVWNYWESLGAKQNLLPEELVCFSLFKAISVQNGDEMRLQASSLLKKENLPVIATDFLAASVISGAVLTNDALWADKFWKSYKKERSSNDPLPLYLLVLEAHIENNIQNL